MSNITKITNEDVIATNAFLGGTYGATNLQAIESVGTVTSIASKLVKRSASSEINCSSILCTNVGSPVIQSNGSSNLLGFYGEPAVAQALTIEAPVLGVGQNDNDIENAIVELQDKVDQILTVLKNLGLIAKE